MFLNGINNKDIINEALKLGAKNYFCKGSILAFIFHQY
jgi:hypothetical protein